MLRKERFERVQRELNSCQYLNMGQQQVEHWMVRGRWPTRRNGSKGDQRFPLSCQMPSDRHAACWLQWCGTGRKNFTVSAQSKKRVQHVYVQLDTCAVKGLHFAGKQSSNSPWYLETLAPWTPLEPWNTGTLFAKRLVLKEQHIWFVLAKRTETATVNHPSLNLMKSRNP